MSGKPQLLYFDLTARGEIIRLLYKHAGVEFEDKRLSFEEYGKDYKSNGELVPLGFLPVLTTPCGKKISQTTAVIRYVANELNLFGKCNVQRAVIDSTIICNKEIGDFVVDIVFSSKSDKEKEELKEKMKKTMEKYFAYFERLIKESGGPFINGSEMTVGDIYLYDTVVFAESVLNVLDKFSLLQNVFDKVKESENIKKYLESQKK